MAIKKILISQPKPENVRSPYQDIAEKFNLDLTFQRFIKVETLSSLEFREQKISFSDITALIFNTRTAIEHFFALIKELRISISEDMKYYCLNEQIANYLQKFITVRKRKVYFPKVSNNDEFIKLIVKHSEEHFFMPVTEGYKRDFIELLQEHKLEVQAGVMFRTVPVILSEELKAQDFDLIALFTPMGVKSLQENFPNLDSSKTKLIAFGPKTAKAIEEAGYSLALSAPMPECPTMPKALEYYLSKKK